MRSVMVACALLAGCGYSEGGTRVTVRASVAASAACPWQRASLTLRALSLVEAASGAALRASHGTSDPTTTSALRLDLARAGAVDLAVLEPPPGPYGALELAWGPDHERGWPMIEVATATATRAVLEGEGAALLTLSGAALAADGAAEVALTGWTCPNDLADLEPMLARVSAEWR